MFSFKRSHFMAGIKESHVYLELVSDRGHSRKDVRPVTVIGGHRDARLVKVVGFFKVTSFVGG